MGKIIATGSPEELIRRAEIPDRVVVVTDRPIDLQKLSELPSAAKVVGANLKLEISSSDVTRLIIDLVRLIEAEQIKLIDLRIERASLEEAFLRMTGEAADFRQEYIGL